MAGWRGEGRRFPSRQYLLRGRKKRGRVFTTQQNYVLPPTRRGGALFNKGEGGLARWMNGSSWGGKVPSPAFSSKFLKKTTTTYSSSPL